MSILANVDSAEQIYDCLGEKTNFSNVEEAILALIEASKVTKNEVTEDECRAIVRRSSLGVPMSLEASKLLPGLKNSGALKLTVASAMLLGGANTIMVMWNKSVNEAVRAYCSKQWVKSHFVIVSKTIPGLSIVKNRRAGGGVNIVFQSEGVSLRGYIVEDVDGRTIKIVEALDNAQAKALVDGDIEKAAELAKMARSLLQPTAQQMVM